MTDLCDEELLASLLRQDLSSFIQRSFATVDPASHYLHNWHIDAIAHQLERIAFGANRRLIITMPPRSLKSISASIASAAWLLGHFPERRVLAVSYSESLAEKLAHDCLKVMSSNWYQRCFPRTRIAKGRSRKADFETSRGGGRYSVSVGGALTGRGGDLILIDDPHKPEDGQSEVKRKSVLDWYGSTLLSRCNDPQTTPIVLIQQRIHENDLAGMLLGQGGWKHLNLQAIAEVEQTYDLGWRGKVRVKENDLLHVRRLPRRVLDEYRTSLGSYVFAAQYQQRPAPTEGGIIKWKWFRTHQHAPSAQPVDEIVQSWDTAMTAGELNDYSACTTWHVRGPTAWLVDVWRDKLEYPELQKKIQSHAYAFGTKRVLIEQAGSGISLLQDLRRFSRLNVVGVVPKQDKASRLMSVSAMVEAGRVSVPENARWLADFRHELILFPNGRHDDQVDSMTQFLSWLDQPAFEWYVSGSK